MHAGLFLDEKRSVEYLASHAKEFMADEDYNPDVAPDGLPVEPAAAAAASTTTNGGDGAPMEGVVAQ